MNQKSFIYGIITGITIGSITTLLVTPKSGKDVKKVIKNNYVQLNDFMHKAKNDSLAVKDQVKETIQLSSNTLKTVSKELKESVEEWQNEVEPTIAKLKEDIEQLTKTVQSHSK